MNSYIKGFAKYRFMLNELVKKGIKLKYRRSYLGVLWTLLEPLLTTIVLSVVFTTILGTKKATFPVYILGGRLLYTFFSQATTTAMKSVRNNQALIKKVYVPKYLYPLSCCLYNYVTFLISLVILFIFMAVFHVPFTMKLLWLVVPLTTVVFLAYGIGLILATVEVFFRDMDYLWSVFLMIIMYTSAIFYYPEKLLHASWKGWLLKLNPLYCVIANVRAAVFSSKIPYGMMLYAIAFAIVSVLFGTYIFYKKQDKFILYI